MLPPAAHSQTVTAACMPLDTVVVSDWHRAWDQVSDDSLRRIVQSETGQSGIINIQEPLQPSNIPERRILYGTYRLTDHFKTSSNLPELPRFVAGVELNIF